MTVEPKIDLKDAKSLDEVKQALTTFQEAVITGNKETAENAKKHLEAYQEKADEVAKQAAEAEKKAAELEEVVAKSGKRVEELELEVSKRGEEKSDDPDVERKGQTYQDFFGWMKKGDRADIDHKNLGDQLAVKAGTLRTDSDTAGGFLLPNVMDNELRKNIVEISPVRLFARQRPMASKTMEVPRRGKGLGRAPFEGELEQGDEGISTYVQEQVTAYRQTWTVPASNDMLLSSAFDLEGEIVSDVGEAFGLGEGYNFLHGTGDKGPKGIVADDRVGVVTSDTTGQITFEDFATIAGQLKKGQRPWFFMNRKTLAEVWKLKGSDGHPIWAPVAHGGASPATIFGFPYNSDMIDLDDHSPTTSNTKPIIFGDLARGYEVFDLQGVVVIRDDYTQKKKAIIEWTFHRYLTGQVIQPEAIKILKIK